MAHRILNMPIAHRSCHNVLQAFLFLSLGQCRHVCSCLFVKRLVTALMGCAMAMAFSLRGEPWQKDLRTITENLILKNPVPDKKIFYGPLAVSP